MLILLPDTARGRESIAFILPPRTGTRSIEQAVLRLKAKRIGTRHWIPRDLDYDRVVTTVRNPYDVLVSWYHFPDPQYPRDRSITLGGNGRSFREWLEFVFAGGNRFLLHSTLRFADRAQQVIRFEDGIEPQLNALLHDAGYPIGSLRHIGHTPRASWEAFYPDDLREAVYNKYKADFCRFGYLK